VTLRRAAPRVEVGPGERVLARAESPTGTLAGTRDALYLPVEDSADPRWARIPWEQVEAADWDRESELLLVTEVGTWGEPRPEHRLVVTESGRLLELVRERVTASVVLQRHVPVFGKRGVRVIARRAPRGDQGLRWLLEYDPGVDPADPFVDQAAHEAVAAAREEVGDL
jgi:hypothetical protein